MCSKILQDSIAVFFLIQLCNCFDPIMLTTTAILNYYYELDFMSQNSLQVLSPRQIRGKLNYGPFPGANSEHKSALQCHRNQGGSEGVTLLDFK